MDTTQQTIAGVYTLLRRPSESKLHYMDALERMNDILRGYVQDMDLGGRDQRTETASVTIDEDDIDYLVRLPNVPDFEPVRLEYAPLAYSQYQPWFAARVVPLSSWETHFGQNYTAASFYGSTGLQDGMRLRLNLDPSMVSDREWRITYRVPLLTIVQLGERPPIPTNFLPMLKYDTALDCMSIVSDDTEDWKKWVAENTQKYAARVLEWRARWEEYLNSSVEPSTMPVPRFDDFRKGGRVYPRAYLPLQ